MIATFEALVGTSWGVFLGVTLILMGGATYLTAQALANTWRPVWQVFFYVPLLGFADRFLVWALYEGDLLSWTGYGIDTLLLLAIGLVAYRITKARRMVEQYPWLYERVGLFGWRERRGET